MTEGPTSGVRERCSRERRTEVRGMGRRQGQAAAASPSRAGRVFRISGMLGMGLLP